MAKEEVVESGTTEVRSLSRRDVAVGSGAIDLLALSLLESSSGSA